MTWQFQATGDETEVFRQDDDEATPIVLVPFLDGEAVEDHQARCHLVVRAPGIANVDRYSAELDALELPPNGDDFNAVIALLGGAPYHPPRKEGR
ncbi:MAG TPA: hypothetical protein H9899_07210 [Candidatus Sphingomonas excrementigallinarum]|nr:hypothetical protein [Candidatus Sphingomonas excrementigallinarum]